MAQLALGIVGAFLGSFFGPIGAAIGWSLGAAIGASLHQTTIEGPHLTDLKLQTSAYGAPIPIHYGTLRATGASVIWQTDLVPHRSTSGGGKKSPKVTSTSYTASFAILLCETSYLGAAGVLINRPIIGIKRIWADKRLIWSNGETVGSDVPLPFTLYLGTEDQLPDPTMEADKGVGNVPAHRGYAYIVFTDLQLEPYFNRIPTLEFEIQASGEGGPVLLHRYATWDVDDVAGAYSYPYALNGQRLVGGSLYSYKYQAANDYGPDPNDGSFSYSYTVHTLLGELVTTSAQATVPFPAYGSAQPGGFPLVFGFKILGSMNSSVAYCAGNVQQNWPDGTGGIKSHYVSGWMVDGGVGNIYTEEYLATLVDGEGPDMEINGTVILSKDGKYVYATGGGILLDTFVKRYPVINGRPALTDDASYSWAIDYPAAAPNNRTQGNGFDVIEADDGTIYVMGTINLQSDPVLFHFSKTLQLIGTWTFADTSVTREGTQLASGAYLRASQGFSSFTVYRDYLILYQSTDGETFFGVPSAILYHLDDDGRFSLVNHIPAIQSPVIYLGQGFMAVRDGILDLGSPGGGITLGEIVADVSNHVGFAAGGTSGDSEYDVSDLPDPVRGYSVTSQMTGRAAVEALMPAFVFSGVESDAIVRFQHFGKPSLVTIPDDDLGAREAGTGWTPLMQTVHVQEEELPRRIFVKFWNVDADYQDGAQLWETQATTSRLDTTLNLPIVFTDDEAKLVASRLGYNAWMEREHHTITVPRTYLAYEPLDTLTARGREMRITSKDELAGNVIKFEGVPSSRAVFVQSEAAGVPGDGFTEPVVITAQASQLLMLDIPLLRETDFPNGYYAAMAGAVREDWVGAELLKSGDAGATYASVGSATVPDIIGFALAPLGAFYGGNIFDELNYALVEIGPGGGDLSSLSRLAVLGGANLALLGDELIQFRDAMATGVGTYRLSGLLRGRYGTEWAMTTHMIFERFVMLPPQTNVNGPFSELYLARLFKAVTYGNAVANADAVSFSNSGVALKCLAPVHLGGGRIANGNATLVWTRRTRINGQWVDYIDAPLSEASEQYVVGIWASSAYATLKNAWLVTGAQTTTYTAAQQTTDFGAPQSTIYFTVAQIGAAGQGYRGRGIV